MIMFYVALREMDLQFLVGFSVYVVTGPVKLSYQLQLIFQQVILLCSEVD